MELLLKCFKFIGLFCSIAQHCLSFELNGRHYDSYIEFRDGVTEQVIYPRSSSKDQWIVKGSYNKSYLHTGWDTLYIEGNPDASDEELALLAGYLEGKETSAAIYDHWYNTVRVACQDEEALCQQVDKFLDTNLKWVQKMIGQHAATDSYWMQVNLFYKQIAGLYWGYNKAASSDNTLMFKDIFWMSFMSDISELKSALKGESDQALRGEDHCSAIIKVLHGQSDVLVAHNTWTGYHTMRRIMKRYTLPLGAVPGSSMSFSGYPGSIISKDDFYIINSGLVAQETTIGNNNKSLWSLVQPEGQVLEVVRVTVANRLAQGGRSWAKIFSRYNSGTYNNQWMIVDMKKFSTGSVKPELLWIVEQIPGQVRAEDQTDLLLRQGYWASYNVPFYPDIFNKSGYQDLVTKFGDFFSHDKSPRAQIFRRDQEKVTDIDSLMSLMRSNNYRHDPLSKCDCSPPYSAENAIAARCDLNPANGSYPIPALGHRSHGATDAKVTSSRLSHDLSLLAVSGPSTGSGLPPFQWSRSGYDQLSHRGHPDIFLFSPVLFTWPDIPDPKLSNKSPSVQMIP